MTTWISEGWPISAPIVMLLAESNCITIMSKQPSFFLSEPRHLHKPEVEIMQTIRADTGWWRPRLRRQPDGTSHYHYTWTHCPPLTNSTCLKPPSKAAVRNGCIAITEWGFRGSPFPSLETLGGCVFANWTPGVYEGNWGNWGLNLRDPVHRRKLPIAHIRDSNV